MIPRLVIEDDGENLIEGDFKTSAPASWKRPPFVGTAVKAFPVTNIC